MKENPYQPPNACDVGAPFGGSRIRLHLLGLVIFAVAAFFIHALATKVPAGELRILESPWVAAALSLASISVLVLGAAFFHQYRRLSGRSEIIYVSAPVAMHAYFAWRVIAG